MSESDHGTGRLEPAWRYMKWSNTVVLVVDWLCDVSAIPPRMDPLSAGMETVEEGYAVQFVPSVDVYAVYEVPVRTTFTQIGALPVTPESWLVEPPLVVLY